MLKQTVTYTDYDGEEVTEDLYFNLTREQLSNHLYIKDDFEEISEIMQSEERTLSTEEIMKINDLIKKFIEISYGVRYQRQDGRTAFRKTQQDFDDFRWSAAYDAFVWSLYENPERASQFLTAIMPADLLKEAEKKLEEQKQGTNEK